MSSQQSADTARVRMHAIGKSFGGVAVLSDVGFHIEPGEIVALLGANGAGKSTLMKIMTGVYSRDTGEVAINGQPVVMSAPKDAVEAGISFLPQEISVMPEMTVAENIYLGLMRRKNALGLNNTSDMETTAKAMLAQVGFDHIPLNAQVGHLSVAEQRVVEIARALAIDAQVLVMDEPTAALSEQDAQTMFEALRSLRNGGTSIVYISHYLSEVFEIADRIEVLRDGLNAGSFRTQDTTIEAVLEAMLGRTADKLFDHRPSTLTDTALLELSDLSWREGLHGVSLTVRPGEMVGVFGLVGSGVEHLGKVIFGAEAGGLAGSMRLDGKPYSPRSPRDGKAQGIGYVTAERKTDGILSELSVAQNLAAAFWPDYRNGPFASKSAETQLADRWIESFSIRTQGPEQVMRFLSGGNQQKVCVARWLHEGVRLLILEEPTRGVDMGARRDIYARLGDYAAEGLAILVLSSDAEEIAGLCDRSMVMNRGRIVGRFDAGADTNTLMAATANGVAMDA
ncbi:MAG: sugar ABC transporter ATP-binding protein [Hyphomicrobiales bacterium]|jgi:ribose transport system ATP-binding protein